MRVVVCGAGGVGAGIGGFLHRAGTPVVLVARGEHAAVMRRDGLTVLEPGGSFRVDAPVVESVADVAWREGDLALLATKVQDAGPMLGALAAVAPHVPVVCAQNGLEGERMVARRGLSAHGMLVWLPATHLVPGEVRMHGAPFPGILDMGSWPGGVDPRLIGLRDALRAAEFDVELRPDILAWKRRKLITNVVGLAHALLEPPFDTLVAALEAEAEAVFAAAGADVVGRDAFFSRHGALQMQPVGAEALAREGGSAWQSLVRGTSSEVDFLNGEICALGARHGVDTPCNRAIVHATHRAAAVGARPRSLSEADILREAGEEA